MHMKACCRARGLDYMQPSAKALTAAINEKFEAYKAMTKVSTKFSALQWPRKCERSCTTRNGCPIQIIACFALAVA